MKRKAAKDYTLLLYSPYYSEACNELRDHRSAEETQLTYVEAYWPVA